MVVLALLLATCRGTGKDLVINKAFSPSNTKVKDRNYTVAWSNKFTLPPLVTVNDVVLSSSELEEKGVFNGFYGMAHVGDVWVLQFPNETLYAFSASIGAPTQNSQLILVRLTDQKEGVSVIGPTPLDDQFERIEITPIKDKGWMGSLFNFYIGDDKVAVYQYSEGGYLNKLQPAASLGGVWYQRYTATREASIAEVIATALEYKNLDPVAREILAGVISGGSQSGHEIYYSVDKVRYTYRFHTARIELYIKSKGKSRDRKDHVEIVLSRRNNIFDYIVQSVTLTN